MESFELQVDEETRGWHRYITHQTTILPTRVYFEGGNAEDRSMADLVIEVKASSLDPEPLRFPPPKEGVDNLDPEAAGAAAFPLRRTDHMTIDELNEKLDAILFVPFRLVVRPD
jgi:hypothetical protein